MPSDTALVRALGADLRPGVEDNGLVAQLEEHVEDYARVLDVSQDVLKYKLAQRDADLAVWLRDRLQQRHRRAQDERRWAASSRTQAVAQKLAEVTVVTGGSVYVDVALLLELRGAHGVRFFAFDIGLPNAVIVSRKKLLELARNVRFQHRRAWFDERGLHIRWCDGRGGLDLRSQAVPRRDLDHVLVISLRPRPVPEPLPTRASAPPASRQRSWLGEALSELALA